MHFKPTFWFAVIFICLPLNPVFSNSDKNCEQLLLRSDRCIRKAVFIGDPNFVIPKTVAEIDTHCVTAKSALRCVREYGQCLKLFPKTVFNIVTGNVKKVIKTICGSTKGKQDALDQFKCVRKEHLSDIHKFIDTGAILINYIAKNVAENEIIPWMCCLHFSGLDKVIDKVSKVCGPEQVQFVLSIVKAIVSDAVDIGCGRYASLTYCEANLKQAMDTFRELTTPESKIVPQNFTGLVPALEIARRLDHVL